MNTDRANDGDREHRLAALLDATHPETRAREERTGLLPVLPELAPLLPDGGLPTGVVTEVTDMSLLLALTAGVSAQTDAHTAVVGMPDLGLSAWDGYGQDLRRVALVEDPSEHWAEVVSVLAGAFDCVITTPPPGALTAKVAQRLGARLRQRRCALVTPAPWPGSAVRLEVTASGGWLGLGQGWGQVAGRKATVRSSGRGVWRPRTVELWLPNERGEVGLVDAEQAVVPLPKAPAVFDVAARAY